MEQNENLENFLADYNAKQLEKKKALSEKKARAGRLGAAVRQEGLKRAAEAKRVAADKSLDEQRLQAELQKLRQELGIITWTQKAENVPGSTEYYEFLWLGETVLSGIIWNKNYPGVQEFIGVYDEDRWYDDQREKPVNEQKFFRIAPDWACERMIGIGQYEYKLPEQLIHFEIKVFENFLEWASSHLKDGLHWLPDIAEELENRKAGREMFNQELHDKIQKENKAHQEGYERHRPAPMEQLDSGYGMYFGKPTPDPMIVQQHILHPLPPQVSPVRTDLPFDAVEYLRNGGKRF